MRRLPRWAAVAAVVALAVALGSSPLAAQQADDEVRVYKLEGEPDGEVTLVVTTPPAVIGASLPDSAFTVLQDGAPVPADVVPYSSERLEIALVLGARSTASLNAEQESGAEFLRFLGGSGRIAVVDASGPRTLVPMTDDGDRVGQALLEVENAASSEPTSEAAVEAALEEFSDDASRRAVVLMTDDNGAVSPGLAGRLVEAGASLHYIQAAVQAEPVPSLVDAAEASGGRAQQGDLRGLIRTVDEVRADFDNQYRVRFTSTAPEAEVRVLTAGGVLTGTVDLAAPPPTVPPREEEAAAPPVTEARQEAAEDDGGGGNGAAVAVVALLVLLIGAGVAALLMVRRRRNASPPVRPVVLDLRETPPAAPAPGEARSAAEPGRDPGP